MHSGVVFIVTALILTKHLLNLLITKRNSDLIFRFLCWILFSANLPIQTLSLKTKTGSKKTPYTGDRIISRWNNPNCSYHTHTHTHTVVSCVYFCNWNCSTNLLFFLTCWKLFFLIFSVILRFSARSCSINHIDLKRPHFMTVVTSMRRREN